MENQIVENCNSQVSKALMRVFVASTDRKFQMELIRRSSRYAALHVFMIFWCKEKELSKKIPRFLSDLLNSIEMPLIFKVEGKA
mgnify:CR=1 FL=1